MDDSECRPAGVTIAQEVRVVVVYIDARPARMHEPFKMLVVEALRAAWPCR
jgi:Rap1a immunity proteins